jgi:hypothetical protein
MSSPGSLLADPASVLNPEFFSGLKLLNSQPEQKVELLFSRILEHETAVRYGVVGFRVARFFLVQ